VAADPEHSVIVLIYLLETCRSLVASSLLVAGRSDTEKATI